MVVFGVVTLVVFKIVTEVLEENIPWKFQQSPTRLHMIISVCYVPQESCWQLLKCPIIT
jgi:hypothetical protein